MSRPCVKRHPEVAPSICPICRLYLTDEFHNRAWGGNGLGLQVIPPEPRGQCEFLGGETGERRLCKVCRGHVELKVYECRHPAHNTTVLRDCLLCSDHSGRDVPLVIQSPAAPGDGPFLHAALTEEKSIGWCSRVFQQPQGPWPARWEGFPNIIAAFREMYSHAAANPPEPPQFAVPRGIVICGGGWRFFPSIYVTVRVIRHVGCHLPIQIWQMGDRGECDPRMVKALSHCGPIEWVDANAWWRNNPACRVRRLNIDDGWMLKPWAAAFSPFREVISLDADCYPAYNPERFIEHSMFQACGAAFWSDFNPLELGQWERFGVPFHDELDVESGQFIVDKARHWRPLWLTAWMNAFHDYVYKHVYGDKSTFHLSWRKCGHEMWIPGQRPGWSQVAFLQRDFDGKTLFVHRTRDKFRWTGQVDGRDVGQWYMTHQNSTNAYLPFLPHEDFCHQALKESRLAIEGDVT